MAAELFDYRGYLHAAFHLLLPAVQWEVKAAGRGRDKGVSKAVIRSSAQPNATGVSDGRMREVEEMCFIVSRVV